MFKHIQISAIPDVSEGENKLRKNKHVTDENDTTSFSQNGIDLRQGI